MKSLVALIASLVLGATGRAAEKSESPLPKHGPVMVQLQQFTMLEGVTTTLIVITIRDAEKLSDDEYNRIFDFYAHRHIAKWHEDNPGHDQCAAKAILGSRRVVHGKEEGFFDAPIGILLQCRTPESAEPTTPPPSPQHEPNPTFNLEPLPATSASAGFFCSTVQPKKNARLPKGNRALRSSSHPESRARLRSRRYRKPGYRDTCGWLIAPT